MAAPIPPPPGFIDANLGLQVDPDAPPPLWVDMLTGYAPKIRRVMVTGKRGSAKYQPIPGGQWEIAELAREIKPEDADERHHDAAAWAKREAKRAWAYCLEWSATNGRPCDVQCCALGFDEKKGAFYPLDAKAKHIADEQGGSGLVSDLTGQGEAKILAWVIIQQQSALERAHARGDKVYGELEQLFSGMRGALTICMDMFGAAIKERELFASTASTERKEHRDFLLEMVKQTQRAHSIDKAIDRFGPLLEELAETFLLGNDAPGSEDRRWQKIARGLRASISDDQIEAAKAGGLGDLVSDILSILSAIELEADREKAKAIVMTLAQKIRPHAKTLQPILTDGQRLEVYSLFKFAGMTG